MQHALKGSGNLRDKLGQLGGRQIANLETNFGNVVPGKVCRIQLQGVDFGSALQLNQAPIVPDLSPTPGFPAVEDLSLFAVGIGIEQGWPLLEKILCRGEPVVRGKEYFGAVRSTGHVGESIGKETGRSYILAGCEGSDIKICDASSANGIPRQLMDGRFDGIRHIDGRR